MLKITLVGTFDKENSINAAGRRKIFGLKGSSVPRWGTVWRGGWGSPLGEKVQVFGMCTFSSALMIYAKTLVKHTNRFISIKFPGDFTGIFRNETLSLH